MSRADRTASLHAQALSVFSESFVRDRRVVVVGDSALGIGERLLDLGARTVHLYDTAEGAPRDPGARGLTVRRLTGDFEVRDGAFDLALVPDLGDVPDPSGLLTRLRRVVSESGALVCAAKNPQLFPGEGIDYSELYDMVALQFEHVVVSGQIAWGGVAFARLGDEGEARDVTVDSQLVAEPPPIEGYVLVASQSDVEPDGYVIVQLPGAVGQDAPDSVEFAQARLRAELLTAQLEEQRALSTRLQHEIQSRGPSDARAEIEAARESQREALGRIEARAQQAELRAQQAESRAQQAESRAQQEFARAERLVQNAKDLGEVVDGEREEAKRLAREVEAERKARKKLEIEAQLLREQVETSERPGIRVLSPRRGRIADVETTVAIREDELASLADELEAGPADRAPDSSEAVTIPRSDQVAIKLKAESARRAAAEESLRRAEDALRAADEGLRAALARASDAESSLKSVEMRAEEAEQRADEAERRLQELEDEVARAEGRAQRAEERIGRFETEAQTIGEALAQELARHEQQLRERGQAIAELQRELVRREHIVHELLAALDERGGHRHDHAAPPAHGQANGGAVEGARLAEELATQRADAERLRAKLEALSHELARYQGELFARDWRIQELEQNLSLADAGAASPPSRSAASTTSAPEVEALRRELAKTEEELSALRQALTQEHAARMTAESAHPGPAEGGTK